jgi:hypothetical protein
MVKVICDPVYPAFHKLRSLGGLPHSPITEMAFLGATPSRLWFRPAVGFGAAQYASAFFSSPDGTFQAPDSVNCLLMESIRLGWGR